jgi:hypothetical protein
MQMSGSPAGARKTFRLYDVAVRWRTSDELPDAYFRFIGLGEPSCFRCGWLPPIDDVGALREEHPDWNAERRRRKTWRLAQRFLDAAHLEDFCDTRNNDLSNVLPLCHFPCHHDMPEFRAGERAAALAWVETGERRPGWWQAATDHIQPESRRELKSIYRVALEEIIRSRHPSQLTPRG